MGIATPDITPTGVRRIDVCRRAERRHVREVAWVRLIAGGPVASGISERDDDISPSWKQPDR
jgi:hypothetical protein